jgi:hypothetical protein
MTPPRGRWRVALKGPGVPHVNGIGDALWIWELQTTHLLKNNGLDDGEPLLCPIGQVTLPLLAVEPMKELSRSVTEIQEGGAISVCYSASRKSVPQTGTFAEARAWEGERLASRTEASR